MVASEELQTFTMTTHLHSHKSVHSYKGALLHRDMQSHKDAHTKACTHTKVRFYIGTCNHTKTHTQKRALIQRWDFTERCAFTQSHKDTHIQ